MLLRANGKTVIFVRMVLPPPFKRPANGYAAAMIDAAGLKGFRIGDAAVSEKHAGFVVNLGNASFADVLSVMEHVQNEVYKKFSVELEPEVKIIR